MWSSDLWFPRLYVLDSGGWADNSWRAGLVQFPSIWKLQKLAVFFACSNSPGVWVAWTTVLGLWEAANTRLGLQEMWTEKWEPLSLHECLRALANAGPTLGKKRMGTFPSIQFFWLYHVTEVIIVTKQNPYTASRTIFSGLAYWDRFAPSKNPKKSSISWGKMLFSGLSTVSLGCAMARRVGVL